MADTQVTMRVVIPGGSGQVGTILARAFHRDGHRVVVLSRRPHIRPWRVVEWDGTTLGDWQREIDGADVVINLAGRSVNCRYNAANRRDILAVPRGIHAHRRRGDRPGTAAATHVAASQHGDDLCAPIRCRQR